MTEKSLIEKNTKSKKYEQLTFVTFNNSVILHVCCNLTIRPSVASQTCGHEHTRVVSAHVDETSYEFTWTSLLLKDRDKKKRKRFSQICFSQRGSVVCVFNFRSIASTWTYSTLLLFIILLKHPLITGLYVYPCVCVCLCSCVFVCVFVCAFKTELSSLLIALW